MNLFQVARTRNAVSTRFDSLLTRITPASTARTKAEGRAGLLGARLQNRLSVKRTLLGGSFYKETAVRRHSDLDLFVVLEREEVRWGGRIVASTTALNTVRDALQATYPTTAIRRDGVAITVAFEQGSAPVDVVPAYYLRHDQSMASPVYAMPDGDGGWMETAPDAERRRFAVASLSSGRKLARVVRLIKWWARERAVPLPLSMYHLESLIIGQGLAAGVRRYADIVADTFACIADRKGAALRDTVGLPGLVDLAHTDAKVDAVLRATHHAAGIAARAIAAEGAGELAEAVHQWRLIFPGYSA